MKYFMDHFINLPDMEEIIKMQASMTAPYQKAVDIRKEPKNIKVNSFSKVKKIGKRR